MSKSLITFSWEDIYQPSLVSLTLGLWHQPAARPHQPPQHHAIWAFRDSARGATQQDVLSAAPRSALVPRAGCLPAAAMVGRWRRRCWRGEETSAGEVRRALREGSSHLSWELG